MQGVLLSDQVAQNPLCVLNDCLTMIQTVRYLLKADGVLLLRLFPEDIQQFLLRIILFSGQRFLEAVFHIIQTLFFAFMPGIIPATADINDLVTHRHLSSDLY